MPLLFFLVPVQRVEVVAIQALSDGSADSGATLLMLRAGPRFRAQHRPGQYMFVHCEQIGKREWCVVAGRSPAPRDTCGLTPRLFLTTLAASLFSSAGIPSPSRPLPRTTA